MQKIALNLLSMFFFLVSCYLWLTLRTFHYFLVGQSFPNWSESVTIPFGPFASFCMMCQVCQQLLMKTAIVLPRTEHQSDRNVGTDRLTTCLCILLEVSDESYKIISRWLSNTAGELETSVINRIHLGIVWPSPCIKAHFDAKCTYQLASSYWQGKNITN